MWHGGVDPVSYIRSFKGRVRLLHLKDYRIGLVTDPLHRTQDILLPRRTDFSCLRLILF